MTCPARPLQRGVRAAVACIPKSCTEGGLDAIAARRSPKPQRETEAAPMFNGARGVMPPEISACRQLQARSATASFELRAMPQSPERASRSEGTCCTASASTMHHNLNKILLTTRGRPNGEAQGRAATDRRMKQQRVRHVPCSAVLGRKSRPPRNPAPKVVLTQSPRSARRSLSARRRRRRPRQGPQGEASASQCPPHSDTAISNCELGSDRDGTIRRSEPAATRARAAWCSPARCTTIPTETCALRGPP